MMCQFPMLPSWHRNLANQVIHSGLLRYEKISRMWNCLPTKSAANGRCGTKPEKTRGDKSIYNRRMWMGSSNKICRKWAHVEPNQKKSVWRHFMYTTGGTTLQHWKTQEFHIPISRYTGLFNLVSYFIMDLYNVYIYMETPIVDSM